MRVTVNFVTHKFTCHTQHHPILSIDFLSAYSFICMYFQLPNIKWLFWTANIANIIINIWLINTTLINLTDVSTTVTDFAEQFNLSTLIEWMLVWLCCAQTKPLVEKKKKNRHFWNESIECPCHTNMLPQLKISFLEVYIVQIRMITCSHTGNHLEKES